LTYASDVFNVRPCGLCRTPDWPAAVLMIASAYENTGRIGEAAETYRRFLLARPGGLAWQDNRALVSLASIEARPETLARALQHFARALDMTLGYPASFGAQYQDDTWRRLMDVTQEALDVFGNVAWDATRLKVQQKADEWRRQGFIGPTMASHAELAYTGIVDALATIDREFVLRREEAPAPRELELAGHPWDGESAP